MKEFSMKKGRNFGFIVNFFSINGVAYANVILFTGKSSRKTTLRVEDMIIED